MTTQRTITLPADQWEAILEAVECHCDEGPPRLSAASAALSSALAEPEPEEPTDVELQELLYYEFTTSTGHGETSDPIGFARAALARWGRPAIEPVPVSERPWEREGWCDGDGWCWGFDAEDTDPYWSFDKPEGCPTWTHLLPHDALPAPAQQGCTQLR